MQVSDSLGEQEPEWGREEPVQESSKQRSRGHEDGGEHAEHTALHFLSWFKFNQNLSALIIPKMS